MSPIIGAVSCWRTIPKLFNSRPGVTDKQGELKPDDKIISGKPKT
jgi:hypothetical protein